MARRRVMEREMKGKGEQVWHNSPTPSPAKMEAVHLRSTLPTVASSSSSSQSLPCQSLQDPRNWSFPLFLVVPYTSDSAHISATHYSILRPPSIYSPPFCQLLLHLCTFLLLLSFYVFFCFLHTFHLLFWIRTEPFYVMYLLVSVSLLLTACAFILYIHISFLSKYIVCPLSILSLILRSSLFWCVFLPILILLIFLLLLSSLCLRFSTISVCQYYTCLFRLMSLLRSLFTLPRLLLSTIYVICITKVRFPFSANTNKDLVLLLVTCYRLIYMSRE